MKIHRISPLAVLPLLWGLSACSSGPCEVDEDCIGGRSCVSGVCKLVSTSMGFDSGPRPDFGFFDGGTPDAAPDSGAGDGGPTDGAPPRDTGPTGDGGPGADGGTIDMGMQGSGGPQVSIQLNYLSDGMGDQHRFVGELIEATMSGVGSASSTYADQEGGQCVLTTRTYQNLVPLSVTGFNVRVRNQPYATMVLDTDQRYRPDTSFVPLNRVFGQGGEMQVAWGMGQGNLRLDAYTDVVGVPSEVVMITPQPGAFVTLAGGVTLQWIPSGVVGRRMTVELAGSLSSGDVRLVCDVADDGLYALPATATDGFRQTGANQPWELTIVRPIAVPVTTRAPGLNATVVGSITTGWGPVFFGQ